MVVASIFSTFNLNAIICNSIFPDQSFVLTHNIYKKYHKNVSTLIIIILKIQSLLN